MQVFRGSAPKPGQRFALAVRRHRLRPRHAPRGIALRGVSMALLTAITLCGCVTVEKADGPPETLRQAIRDGELVEPGDRVVVVTPSMGERTLRVTEVDEEFIRGEQTEIPIDEIVALEKRWFDPIKTAGVVVGGYWGIVLLFGLAFLAGS